MADLSIGFIGLGAMGGPMVSRLLAEQQAVTVWGRSVDKLEPWLDAGAILADSPRSVAEASDVILLCVTDTDAVQSVVFDANGIAGSNRSAIIVDHSTIHPLATREFADRLKQHNGMRWVDAPVSGGVVGATSGNLVAMVGGAVEDIDTISDILACYTQRITRMGDVGSGQATKVVNQMLIGGNIAVLAEALNYAANFGVSAPAIPAALADGWADSRVLQVHGRRMVAADYAAEVDGHIMQKDIDIAIDMGKQTGSPMPITALVQQLYRQLIATGHADKGQSGLMYLYKDKPL